MMDGEHLAIDDHAAHINVQLANVHRLASDGFAKEGGLIVTDMLFLGRTGGGCRLWPLLYGGGISLGAQLLCLPEQFLRVVRAFRLRQPQADDASKQLMYAAFHPAHKGLQQIRPAVFQLKRELVPLLLQLCTGEQAMGGRKELRELFSQPGQGQFALPIRDHGTQRDLIHLVCQRQRLFKLPEPGVICAGLQRDTQQDLRFLLVEINF